MSKEQMGQMAAATIAGSGSPTLQVKIKRGDRGSEKGS